MAEIRGLTGLRPARETIAKFVTPPYDVMNKGLESLLMGNKKSLYPIILGDNPLQALNEAVLNGTLISDDEPCFYVCMQDDRGVVVLDVLVAAKVGENSEHNIIDHEKVDMAKVNDRKALMEKIGYSFEPIITLTKSRISPILEHITKTNEPWYDFIPDFGGTINSELHGIKNYMFRIRADSKEGNELANLIAQDDLVIADGHHRYTATSLYSQSINKPTFIPMHIFEVSEAEKKGGLQAYNRVTKGRTKFEDIKQSFNLVETSEFKTPPERHFVAVYSNGKSYLLDLRHAVAGVNGEFDCASLDKLFTLLGITDEMKKNPKFLDYHPEFRNPEMKALVDSKRYNEAFALYPIKVQEVIEAAYSGKNLPRKSTYFRKVLSGAFGLKH